MKEWLEVVFVFGAIALAALVTFRWFILACLVVGLWAFV